MAITFVNAVDSRSGSVATTSHVVTMPTGTASGDLCIVAISWNGAPGAITLPTGWTILSALNAGQANPQQSVYYKLLDGSEGASQTWTSGTAVLAGYAASSYRGVHQTTPIDVAATSTSGAAATTATATNITTVTNQAWVVGGAAANSSTATFVTAWTTPPGTERNDIQNGFASGTGKAGTLSDSNGGFAVGTTATITWTISASLAWDAWLTAIRPAPAVAGGTGLNIPRSAPSLLTPFGPNKQRPRPQLQGSTPPSVTVTVPVRAGPDDGSWQYTHTAWPPNPGTGVAVDDTTARAEKTFQTPNYTGSAAFFRFDTSVIPVDAVVIAADLRFFKNAFSSNGADNFKVVGEYYDFGGEPSEAVDWVETISGTSIFTPLVNGFNILTGYNTIPINNLSGINKLGYTGIRITLSAGTPLFTNYLEFRTQESPSPMQLIVTYVPSGFPAAGTAPTLKQGPTFQQPFGLKRPRPVVPAVGVFIAPDAPVGITFQRGPSFNQPFGLLRPRPYQPGYPEIQVPVSTATQPLLPLLGVG